MITVHKWSFFPHGIENSPFLIDPNSGNTAFILILRVEQILFDTHSVGCVTIIDLCLSLFPSPSPFYPLCAFTFSIPYPSASLFLSLSANFSLDTDFLSITNLTVHLQLFQRFRFYGTLAFYISTPLTFVQRNAKAYARWHQYWCMLCH